ncbi:hypothetical protein Dimus_003714 [Dionaea muscipula]
MAKSSRERRRIASRNCRQTPYPLPSYNQEDFEDLYPTNCSNALVKQDLEDVACSVCMEYPHNAVLLLCSSHDKGCRPYMCGTSDRHSNCLDQYKKACTKVTPSNHVLPFHASEESLNAAPVSSWRTEKGEVAELACPLCRGQVKGWTIVDTAREFLNSKKRSCMQENCSFVGNYKELRKHVRTEHPAVRPREVDPVMEQQWRRMENERDHADNMSIIRSSIPGAVVFGDFVIGGDDFASGLDEDEGRAFDANATERRNEASEYQSRLVDILILLHALDPRIGAYRREPNTRPERTLSRGRVVGIHHTTPLDDSDFFNEDHEHDRRGGHTGGDVLG